MKLFFVFLFFSIFLSSSFAREALDAGRYELLTGVRKNHDKKSIWDKKYRRKTYLYGKAPAKFLKQNHKHIPSGSTILDMGMGEGRNAVFLASKGHDVLGVDISSVAVKKARSLAKEQGVSIRTRVASLNKYKIAPESLDAIICFYYVDRLLVKKMAMWLRPGGILIYQAYTLEQKKMVNFAKENEKYLLRPGELLGLFKKMKVLKYEESSSEKGFTAALIAQKLPLRP